MKVLSLFDGMSCGRIAFDRAGISVSKYYASEIDKYAQIVSHANYPDIVRLGDITKWQEWNIEQPDMIIAGSPCQGFSFVGKQLNFNDERSKLFFTFVEIMKKYKPKYFLLENVKMKKEYQDIISNELCCDPIEINSSLVSFQNRKRLYWTNIPNITIPENKKINFQHFKEKDYCECEKYKVKKTPSRIKMWNNGEGKSKSGECANITNSEKIYCLTLKQDRSPNSGLIAHDDFCRYLTRKEIEQAQTLPVGYTNNVSYNMMQKMCGNGWTVDVIAHIFKGIK